MFLLVSGKLPPKNCPLWKYPPMKAPPCENYPPEFFPWENCPLWKLPPPGKIIPNEIPSPPINHTNERKNKITKFFALKKMLIKITKVIFDTQMISQKIMGLDTFFTEGKSRRTKSRQSNYKIWHIGETSK